VLLVTGLVLNYLAGIGPLRTALDRALANAALLYAAQLKPAADGSLTLPLPTDIEAALRSGGSRPRFAVFDDAGRLLAGDRSVPTPAQTLAARLGNEPVFDESSAGDEPLRLAWLRTTVAGRPLIVAAAEPARGRARATLYLLSSTLTIDALLLITILALVVLGVRRGLQPLLALRDRLAARSASELEPLDPQSMPAEVRALVVALNSMFERVRASGEAQQRFLADAAHQVRTPLAGIQAQLELLEHDPAAAPLRERIQAVHQGVRRLAHTAHQLLTLARAGSAATLGRDFRPVELHRLVGETVTAQLDRALFKGLDLGADAQPAVVNGVEWLLRELLDNLVDNALKYTPFGGTVTLRSGALPAGAFLEVEDDGTGIAAAERGRVAQRFHRSPGATASGTGLGLAIVGDIAALHGARLSIAAGDLERGTRIRVEFGSRSTVAP
jgi:two-component system sensor histidine kinase TctE